MATKVKDHFRKRSSPKKEPINPVTRRFFVNMSEKQKKAILSYYDHSIKKC